MNCTDVVECFTDYLDGASAPSEEIAIEEHLQQCPECSRYRDVLIHGTELLRDLPEPDLKDDFTPRLEHRLYHVDDDRAIAAHSGARIQAVTVVGIALLLTGVAWSPTLFVREPAVELPVIVVDEPPLRGAGDTSYSIPIDVLGSNPLGQGAELKENIWVNQLIYDYSPLSDRYERRPRVRRVGQFDR